MTTLNAHQTSAIRKALYRAGEYPLAALLRNDADQPGETMATRPATSLVTAFTRQLARNRGAHRISVARRTMQQWLQWAGLVDGRTRLDGSKKNKQRRRTPR